MRLALTTLASAALLAVSACADMTPSERSAAVGAGVGATAGALVGHDVGSAAVGAVVGGAAGWYLGCVQEGRCGNVDNHRQHYQSSTGRYYFYDPQSGRYFYENGEPYRG